MKKAAMDTTTQTPASTPQDPTEGGSYIRNADGTLTLVQQTQQRGGRAVRAQQAATQTAADEPAPAPQQTTDQE
jgi:hypothetical protein